MPFIKGEKREALDEELATVALTIRGMNEVAKDRKRGPLLSYAILKLLTDVYDGSIKDMIEAIGVIEETKLTWYSMYMLPTEQRILFRRWLDSEGAY